MKVSALTRISDLAPKICHIVPFTGDVLHMKRVFLYCHCPTKHIVVLVAACFKVLQGFMVSLECVSLASQIQFEPSNTPYYYSQALLLYDPVLSLC